MATMETIGRGTAAEGDGSLLLWVLVWSELVAFGALLVAFLVMSVLNPPGVAAMRMHLSPGLAGANTLILVLSGWQAALALRRRGEGLAVRRPLVSAGLLGLAFAAVKLVEYSREFAFASDPAAGGFFELYFLVTGFHLVHVLFGSILLFLVAWRPVRANVFLVATLWHVIDLVWLVMFPILYLA